MNLSTPGMLAAFPVPGPLDIIGLAECGVHGGNRAIGALDEDLARAVRLALQADRSAAAAEALHYGWEHCTELFLAGLAFEEGADPVRRAA